MEDRDLEVGKTRDAATLGREATLGPTSAGRTEKARTGEAYILFQGNPVLCIEGFSDEELQQLVALLEEEEEKPLGAKSYTSVRVSNSDIKDIIRIRRQWHALEPYLGEFDFGLFDPEPPDSFKRYVHINYAADEIAREIEALRVDRQKAEEKDSSFYEAIPTVVVAILALRELDATLRLYPTNIDPNEATRLFDALVFRVEMVLAEPQFEKFKAFYKRPTLGDLHVMCELVLLQTMLLTWHPESQKAGQEHLEEGVEAALRQCQRSVPPDIAKIVARLNEIMLFDCRIPHPVDDPTFQDGRRFLFLLREYWTLVKIILITARDVPVHHQPHALTRLILNLQSRLTTCLQHLNGIEEIKPISEKVNGLIDVMLNGDPDEFAVMMECEPDLVPEVERSIERAALAASSSNFELTHSEANFISLVRQAAENDRATLERKWKRIWDSAKPVAEKSSKSNSGQAANASSRLPSGERASGTVDFLILAALEEEREALLRLLPEHRKVPPTHADVRVYFEAVVQTTGASSAPCVYKTIVASPLGMGRVDATAVAVDAIRRWRPRYVLLVGIAGGIATSGVKLGDVLIANQVADYELQKLTDGEPQIRWNVHQVDPRLLTAAQHFPVDKCMPLMKTIRPSVGQPFRHIGTVVTGDKVIACDAALKQHKIVWTKLVGVEMEAGGAVRAAFQSPNPPGFFMVRAVSDLADADKNSPGVADWRAYACELAAAYTIALLTDGPVPMLTADIEK